MASRPKQAEPRPKPRIYLVTPAIEDAEAFAAPLEAALAAGDIAAVLLRLAPGDERSLINRVKHLAPLMERHEAALILDVHANLVARSGADGAHLTGIDVFAETVETLKPDRIAGCGGLDTRHDAMLAAERGADYVMFGEPDPHGQRPAFDLVEDRIGWWAEVFEAPCVAYAG
ncbi:MAG TPA: thiamine phosphate synthase, partial [Pseudolabrys sp.]